MVAALRANSKCALNRGGNGYMRIYYELTDSLFKIDTIVKREEKDETIKKDENTEKEESGPEESVFGSEKKLESYKDFKDYHTKWVYSLLASSEFLLLHVRMASGEDIKKDILKRAQELLDDKKTTSNQNVGIHYVEKYSLYTELDLSKICMDQAE
jgi:hypothetical protein